MAFWEIRSGGNPVMSSPSSMMRPLVGRSTPVRQLKKVDLPAPFGPMTARISPWCTSIETLLRAVNPPNCIVSPSVRRMVGTPPPRPAAAGGTAGDPVVTLGELARGRNDGLFLGDDLEDLVLSPADLEDELAGEGLVILLTQGLVPLREIVALLHLEPFEGLDELGRVVATLETGLLHADPERVDPLEVRLHIPVRKGAGRIDLLQTRHRFVEKLLVRGGVEDPLQH